MGVKRPSRVVPRAKKKNLGGRPSQGLSEVRVEVPMPAALRDGARRRAKGEGVTVAELIRRALATALGEQ